MSFYLLNIFPCYVLVVSGAVGLALSPGRGLKAHTPSPVDTGLPACRWGQHSGPPVMALSPEQLHQPRLVLLSLCRADR